jgi:solute carrier family 12 sodium/potassium/chloride transporter 2
MRTNDPRASAADRSAFPGTEANRVLRPCAAQPARKGSRPAADLHPTAYAVRSPTVILPAMPGQSADRQGSARVIESEPSTGLGTFGGVFTPSILTILGVIMYLRFGWVVGNVGLIGTLIIVTLSTSITFLTGLSISAIATDRRVRIGGAYYMISRALGIETGGAVGIPLYLAQALSVALYTVGFAESLFDMFPVLNQRVVAVLTTGIVTLVAIRSAAFAIRAQYVIMAAIGLSLLSLLFGSPIEQTQIEMFGVSAARSENFWVVFAVFFPAVTGIMAGVNMSGDLRDPARSIPRGTLAAIGVGYLIYMLLPILLAMRADALTLATDRLIMRRIAFWGDAIMLGVWGATLSSAVGSILAAPRVLQALARDGVLPRRFSWLGRGSGANDEPRIGTVVTMVIALFAVMLGDIDAIAPILTMFFLTTYMVLNISAGIEGFVASPSFRPAFKVHWTLSVLGAVGCIAVMFLINAVATVVAALVILAIYVWLERRGLQAAWGDVRRGMWLTMIRAGLLRMAATPDARNWRPNLLVLSGAPTSRWHLIDLANQFTHARGIVTVSSVIPAGSRDAARVAAMEQTVREYLSREGVQALVRLIRANDTFEGAERLVETYGLGAVVPNTVLLGASERVERRDRYCEMIRHFNEARRNVLILRGGDSGFGDRRRIDVWWGGLQSNGGLMMVLAYLLGTSIDWAGAEVRVNLVVPTGAGAVAARENLERIISRLRIGAVPNVMSAEGRPFQEILQEISAEADLVLLGMAQPDEEFTRYYERMQAVSASLGPTLFVLAAEDLKFGEVLL